MKPSGPDRTATSEADAAELQDRLLRGLSATDRRLRLRRGLAALTWLGPAACVWLLASWLLHLGLLELGATGEGAVAALWPSWAGGAVLLLLGLREVAALGRDLPAAARAVDRAGDLHDAVATALEMQHRLHDSHPDGRREGGDTAAAGGSRRASGPPRRHSVPDGRCAHRVPRRSSAGSRARR